MMAAATTTLQNNNIIGSERKNNLASCVVVKISPSLKIFQTTIVCLLLSFVSDYDNVCKTN